MRPNYCFIPHLETSEGLNKYLPLLCRPLPLTHTSRRVPGVGRQLLDDEGGAGREARRRHGLLRQVVHPAVGG